ncbi:MAG: C39 family peptidase [Elainella sp. C42_A2020_010]|nr:C39 family peptidase [Elainella sp. C42_A2020_010]
MQSFERFDSSDQSRETGEMINATLDLPAPRQEMLSDGSQAVVSGDPASWEGVVHRQGDNSQGYLNTCGVVSCEQIIKRFGIDVTESQLLDYAITQGYCDVSGQGYVSLADQVGILHDYGVPCHTDHNGTLESLADDIENGCAVALAVNSASLYGYAGWEGTDHMIVPTGVARDSQSGEIKGFFYNDSLTGESAYVTAELLQSAWVEQGGDSIVTEGVDMRDVERTLGSWIWTSAQGWIYV